MDDNLSDKENAWNKYRPDNANTLPAKIREAVLAEIRIKQHTQRVIDMDRPFYNSFVQSTIREMNTLAINEALSRYFLLVDNAKALTRFASIERTYIRSHEILINHLRSSPDRLQKISESMAIRQDALDFINSKLTRLHEFHNILQKEVDFKRLGLEPLDFEARIAETKSSRYPQTLERDQEDLSQGWNGVLEQIKKRSQGYKNSQIALDQQVGNLERWAPLQSVEASLTTLDDDCKFLQIQETIPFIKIDERFVSDSGYIDAVVNVVHAQNARELASNLALVSLEE